MLSKRQLFFEIPLEYFLPLFVLTILIAYTYARFFHIPYLGFDFNPSSGEVIDLFVKPRSPSAIRLGDRIVQVGPVRLSDYQNSLSLPLAGDVQKGQAVEIIFQREGRSHTVAWVLPGPTPLEVVDRIINIGLVAYVFWLAGVCTALLVRPKDTRWLLLLGFFFLTAIWIVVGSVSAWKVWKSPLVFRSAIWLCIPVYLHLHWQIPKPLVRLPRLLLFLAYAIGIVFSILEWFWNKPGREAVTVFSFAILGCLIELALHYVFQPSRRNEIKLLASGVVVAFIPLFGSILVGSFITHAQFDSAPLLGFPFIPVVYFFTVYRRQAGGLELRANRFISAYLFLIILGSVFSILAPLMNLWLDVPDGPILVGLFTAVASGILVFMGYPPFERAINRGFLGIKLPSERLLAEYSSQIGLSVQSSEIVSLLRNEILPSLLIRQAALLHLEEDGSLTPLSFSELNRAQLPSRLDQVESYGKFGIYFPPQRDEVASSPFHWVRLILPLQASNKLVGFWLLGRRDPDDYYSHAEISVLQTIANQTAVALVNSSQAEQLRALYQSDIERHEEERVNLARDIHDEILNQLAVLSINVDRNAAPDFEENYQLITNRLRQIVSGLRPAMLIYGLQPALEELVDELSERVEGMEITLQLEPPAAEARYNPKIESHVYRIVQQACENASRHADCSHICIRGSLQPEKIILSIEDDGEGFPDQGSMDFRSLLANKHYGLAGMYERAAIINARLTIASDQGCGTTISLEWNGGDLDQPLN